MVMPLLTPLHTGILLTHSSPVPLGKSLQAQMSGENGDFVMLKAIILFITMPARVLNTLMAPTHLYFPEASPECLYFSGF